MVFAWFQPKQQLSDKHRMLARLSKAAYEGVPERDKVAAAHSLTYDHELSNDRYAVFSSPMESYVAYRGTRPSDPDDLSANAAIAGLRRSTHPRFHEGNAVARRAKEKYGGRVVLTGHSLGGAMAEEASRETGLSAIVFNPGSNPLFPHWLTKPAQVEVVRDPLDVISAGYGVPMDFNETMIGAARNSHGLDNFL